MSLFTITLPLYTVRHNEVLKCIHKSLCLAYNFSLDKRIKRHNVEKAIRNTYADITTDTKVITERPVSENRPDLAVKDHRRKIIYIVDVAISHKNGIIPKEREKIAKYETVRRELSQRTGYKALVLPYVVSWDGNVSNENWKVRKILGISKQVHAYIQQVVMRQIVDIVCRGSSGQIEPLDTWLPEEKVTRILTTLQEEYPEEEEHTADLQSSFTQ